MSLLNRTNRSYFILIFGNIIPAIGIVGFDWSINDTFMFYAIELSAYEIIMLPKIIVYTFTTSEYFYDSVFVKILKSFFIILMHLMIFAFTMIFFLNFGCGVTETEGNVTWEYILFFIKSNYLATVFIFTEYIYVFFSDYIGLKEYEVIPQRYHLIEIYVPIPILLVIIAIIYRSIY